MGELFTTLNLSRLQFTITTLFHMIWPTLTIGLSLLLLIMEVLWLITKDDDYYRHIRFWTKILILNFSIGVATGLVMEFQFGTNWARFSAATGGFFGDILGFEGTLAFMLEAAFLGVMVFGWNKVPKQMHVVATFFVAFGASLSAFWILVANSWMHTPDGGSFVEGKFVLESYGKAIFNRNMGWATAHMWVACVETSAFVVGGVSALYFWKKKHVAFFLKSFRVAAILALVMVPVQIFVGDRQGKALAQDQPEKLAAIESHWETNLPGTGAPFVLFAWPDRENERNAWELTVPNGLSLLITNTPTGEVRGLKEFPPEERPPIVIPFYAFRIMVALGFFFGLVILWTLVAWTRRGLRPGRVENRRFLLFLWIASAPLAYVAVETGWVTREMGRQPWIIYGIMKTEEALSSVEPWVVGASLVAITLLYLGLFAGFFVYLARILRQGPDLTQTTTAG